MARRLSDCALVDEVFIVGANVPSSLLTSGIAGVQSINLPKSHVCERLCAAADASGADWVVCVSANRPFVDATLIDQLLARATKSSECDYVGYASDDGDWRRMVRLGLAGEACHVDTLRRLRRNADRLPSEDGGCIASWLEKSPGAYHLKFIPVPTALDRNDLRFAVEDESDWDDAELLCETVSDEDSQWQELTKLVISNDDLRESMATRNS
jgi:spore coat polysaccharide biosynthesis protein SpsF (cytidylyltransferase family)